MKPIHKSNSLELLWWFMAAIVISWMAFKCLQLTAVGALVTNPPPALQVTTSMAPAAGPVLRTVVFAWDLPPPSTVVAWNFYLVTSSNLVLLGTVNTNIISVANINLSTTNTFGVTALDSFTNESLLSATVSISLPAAPTNLKPVSFH